MRIVMLLASLALFGTAAAASSVGPSISRALFVERNDGGAVSLEPADHLRTGDKVIIVMQWDQPGRTRGFTLASRVPSTLAYQRSGRENVEVSVDGGRKWGRIGTLKVGSRLASPEDVTDLRWRIPSHGGSGMLTYSAVVR